MTLRRPVAPDGLGGLSQIAAPDTIDPAILPASTSSASVPVTIASTDTFTVADNTQAVFGVWIDCDGYIDLGSGVLVES